MTSNARTIEGLVMRMQRDFLENRGLRLTARQAERHFGVDHVTCDAILGVLAESGVLTRSLDGAYCRFFPRLRQAA